MSSPTATSTSAAAPAAVIRHHNYWCHECDMSVLLPPTLTPTPSSPPRCPHCHSDFLENMDSFTPAAGGSDESLPALPATSIWAPSSFPTPGSAAALGAVAAVAAYASGDNFLLNSPHLHRLIQHLTETNNGDGIFYDPVPVTRPSGSKASRRALESLKTITVDDHLLEKDPTLLCPVCKDQFGVNSVAKQLPCNHMYHSDCIIPWLEISNTCPLCRFRLETEEEELGVGLEGGEAYVGAMRLEELVDDDDELEVSDDVSESEVYEDNMRNYYLRASARWSAEMEMQTRTEASDENRELLFSPTQIGEAGNVGIGERANSVETVSSWPNRTFEGGDREVGVGDDGNAVRT